MTRDRSEGTRRRAAQWLQADLMDVEFYSALRGRGFADPMTAAEDFVGVGMAERLSSHPFLDFLSQPAEIRRAWRHGDVGAVLRHLTGEDGRARPAGPLADPVDPDAARADLLALARRLGDEAAGGTDRRLTSVDWSVLRAKALRPDLTSVVVVAAEPRRTIRTVQNVLDRGDGREIEVVVVDRGSAPHAALGLHAAFHGRERVELVRLLGSMSSTAATNLGIARATGAALILLDAQVTVRRGWLPPLLGALDDPGVAGVQPVVLRADDTIDSAGLAVTAGGHAPTPLLAGHPKEDARRLAGERLVAIAGQAMVLRTADVVALEGLRDAPLAEAGVDLCARLLPGREAGFRVAPAALMSLSRKSDAPDPGPVRSYPLLTPDPGIYERIGLLAKARNPGSDRLRWSLKVPSSPGHAGDLWGDTHFADAFAAALRDLGQDVVTSRRGAHAAGPTHLDDVSVALRGLYPISPMPGQVNVLWVISHPDDVDPGEFEGFDVVCAASVSWSADLSARTGREIVPLLQATEFAPPASAPADKGEPSVVFVGNASDSRERPLVWKAVESGVPLAVYGRGWEGLPEGVWRGEYVDNSRLPNIYRQHGIVLADHWADMARNGFIANRVFDALASGARVICDDVVGVHDVFDPLDVVVARSSQEIVAAVDKLNRTARVQSVGHPELMFHDRAQTLLDLLPLR